MMNKKEAQRVAVVVINDDGNVDSGRSLDIKVAQVRPCSFDRGIDEISGFNADVIVLDSGWHLWTGLSALRQIRTVRPNVPVIFMTDVNSAEAKGAAAELGVQEYYEKPVNILVLQRLVEQLLSIRGSTTQEALSPESNGECETVSSMIKVVPVARQQNNIENIVFFIKNNLWSPLELEGLAEKAHLSKFHFCRIFKRHVGMNPMKFVASLRIERAKELLKKESLTVSSVANEVGFKDLSNFIRQFKKMTGMTPSTFRDSSRIMNLPEAMTAVPQTSVGN